MALRLTWLIGLVAVAGTASAQGPASQAQPKPTPEQVAAASLEADRLIGSAHAQAYFVNITKSVVPTVRHLPSGAECSFEPGQQGNEIHVYQSSSLPGEDISCNTVQRPKGALSDIVQTNYISRYPMTPTMNQILADMVASMRQRFPDSKPAGGTFANAQLSQTGSGRTVPPHGAAREELTIEGHHLFDRAAAGVVNDWVVTQRITAPFELASVADLMGEISLISTMIQIADQPPSRAVAFPVAAQEAATDETRRLIRTTQRPAEFVDLTANGVPQLRHIPSGITCRFSLDPESNALVQRPFGLTCAARPDFGDEIVDVDNLSGGPTVDPEAMINRLVARFAKSEALTGFTDAAAKDDEGVIVPHTTRRLLVTNDKQQTFFLRTSYAVVGNWLLVQRVAGSRTAARILDSKGEDAMLALIRQIAARQREAVLAPSRRKLP